MDGRTGNSINTTKMQTRPDRRGFLSRILLVNLSAATKLIMGFSGQADFQFGPLWFADSLIKLELHSGFLNVVLVTETYNYISQWFARSLDITH